jgi:metal-dependent amidase/aminoacylase/carboxypeptidase family protein
MKTVLVSVLVLWCCATAAAATPWAVEAGQGVAGFVRELRQQLHRIPELSYEEVKTSALIRATLDDLGINYTYPMAITGVVATVGHGEPVVALRADFDALVGTVPGSVRGARSEAVGVQWIACAALD